MTDYKQTKMHCMTVIANKTLWSAVSAPGAFWSDCLRYVRKPARQNSEVNTCDNAMNRLQVAVFLTSQWHFCKTPARKWFTFTLFTATFANHASYYIISGSQHSVQNKTGFKTETAEPDVVNYIWCYEFL